MRLTSYRMTLIDSLRMSKAPLTVADMANSLKKTPVSVRLAMRRLEGAGVVEADRSSRPATYKLTPEGYVARGSFPPKEDAHV